MTRAGAIAAAAALSVLLLAGRPAAAEPAWRYGPAFSFGISHIHGQRFDEAALTLQASRRIGPDWRIAGHLHNLRVNHPELAEPSGSGHRLGIGLERAIARYTERGGGAATAYLRAGVTRETIHWERGRLDRPGAYLELRGLVDFDLTRRDQRWFGLGLAVRAYVTRTPALLDARQVLPASSTRPPGEARYDLGVLASWEWTASR